MQFEKDMDDPFNIGQMISEATSGAAGSKRYGIQESDGRTTKKAKVDDDD